MKKDEKFQREKIEIEESRYLNKNCWLAKTLNYSPANRCQYCVLKFHNCLFFQYLIISLILIFFLFTLSFLIEGKISRLVVISIFVLVIIYGYFFNKSSGKIIEANFAQRKANEALRKLTETLEEQVKQKTKKLKKAFEELKKLDKTKTEFLSMASHQLRTPLTAIKGYISLVLEEQYGEISDGLKKPLKNVYLSNERLINLASELLTISRIEMGKLTAEKQPCQIEDLIRSCVEEMKIMASKKKLKIFFEESRVSLPKIDIDPLKIRQVILNLIDNAIKYTQRGEIGIKVKKINNVAQITVRDTGEGLVEKEKESIFEPFTRGEAGAFLFVEGTGLGLSVAKKYLDLHRGKIWAESEGKGKGSTFYIELPVR